MALAVSGELLELVLCALRVVGHGLSDVGEEDPPRLTESRRLVALGAGDSGERVEGFSPNISTQPFAATDNGSTTPATWFQTRNPAGAGLS